MIAGYETVEIDISNFGKHPSLLMGERLREAVETYIRNEARVKIKLGSQEYSKEFIDVVFGGLVKTFGFEKCSRFLILESTREALLSLIDSVMRTNVKDLKVKGVWYTCAADFSLENLDKKIEPTAEYLLLEIVQKLDRANQLLSRINDARPIVPQIHP